MGITKYPNGVSSFGAPVVPTAWGRPVGFGGAGNTSLKPGVQGGTGSQVFFVNSNVTTAADTFGGAGAGGGLTPDKPFKTINFAVSKCIANNGDVIYVGPGHVETVSSAAGLTVGVAGVSIIGLGNGQTDMALVNYTTSTAATVTITAANTYIQNLRFENSIDARVDGIVISAHDCTLVDCMFDDDTGKSSLISIRTTAAANRFRLINTRCLFNENTGTARTEFVRIVGGNDVEIRGFYNNGLATFSTAVINNVTTATNGLTLDSIVASNNTTAPAITLVSGTIGTADNCDLAANNTSVAVFAAQGTGFVIGENISLVSTAATGGFSRCSPGTTFTFQKSVTSSSIKTASPNTFVTCTNGSVLIENMTFETDGTGLAGGTNFQIKTTNTNGLGTLAAETVANLGANKTVLASAASATALAQGFVLESGKVLQHQSTVADCTGAGKLFLNIWGRVLSGSPVLS